MTELLHKIDLYLFYQINYSLTHPALDTILPFIRNKYFWAPLYMFITSFLVINYKRKGLWVIVFMLLTILLCDQLSSSVIKPIVGRLRPCNTEGLQDMINLLVNCGSGKSFPSSHATNHFGFAVFTGGFFFRTKKWVIYILLLWAAAVSYAQIYVGVHYPVDVLAGALLGTGIGLFTGYGFFVLMQYLEQKHYLK